ncbi:hypothetical protein [Streptomyces sp. NBC_01803]|uniref:hypothetical protein n=1 Tax=Streptomyces sp. NBC_01803 TaxID=2975946 RepID=UPI002DD79DFC|nr:hypothetical protein [Streptomyces sp. NBC_01803]WSA45385.1 hypothetical protein OIE51_14910 [Streptomyces sp. NBC_01803]
MTSVSGERVAVLCHRHVPWVAFAVPTEAAASRPRYLSPPTWADHFSWAGFTVLAPEFLDAPASEADLSALRPVEHEQVSCWKPATIGDIVFNDWD